MDKVICDEVSTVLLMLPEKYINKIPNSLKEELNLNIKPDSNFKIEEISSKSKAFLIEIIRRYFGEDEITKKINEYISYNVKLDSIKKDTKLF